MLVPFSLPLQSARQTSLLLYESSVGIEKRLFQASLQPGEREKKELYLCQILQPAGSINV